MKAMNYIIITALGLTLAACKQGPDYQPPTANNIGSWKYFDDNKANDNKIASIDDSSKAEQKFNQVEWWQNFNDPVLNELINKAEQQNLDLKIAEGRIKEARANRLAARADLLPMLNATAAGSRGITNRLFTTKPINDYQVGFDASWELDLFGGNSRRKEAADYILEQSVADKKNVLITLRSEIARDYVEIRNYQNQIDITLQNIKSQEESVKLTKAQRDAGVVSDLDVSQAESLFYNTKSRLPVLKTALEQNKNNLAILLAVKPADLPNFAETKPVPVADKKFIIDTPARIISERPDVKSAERNLAATTALQGAAAAELFPDISLSAFLGYGDNTLASAGKLWSLGSNAVLPIINFGRIKADIKLADARQEQAFNLYQRTILEALAEVQTNLVTYANEEERYENLAQTVASNERAVVLAKDRYNNGISAFTDVLLAQRDLYEAQNQLAESKASVATSLIALNKSLGR